MVTATEISIPSTMSVVWWTAVLKESLLIALQVYQIDCRLISQSVASLQSCSSMKEPEHDKSHEISNPLSRFEHKSKDN